MKKLLVTLVIGLVSQCLAFDIPPAKESSKRAKNAAEVIRYRQTKEFHDIVLIEIYRAVNRAEFNAYIGISSFPRDIVITECGILEQAGYRTSVSYTRRSYFLDISWENK